jgi:hypothetical protein
MIVMSVASVLLAIMVALIPFIATRIVRGDIGSTLMNVVSGVMTAGTVASGLAFCGGSGLTAGCATPSGAPPTPPSGASGASGSHSAALSSSSSGTGMGDCRPPTPPSSDSANGTIAASASSASEAPSTATTTPDSSPATELRSHSGQTSRRYSGHSLADSAAWQTGHAIGRTMRWAGLGAEQ